MRLVYGLLGGLGLVIGAALLAQATQTGARLWGAVVLGLGIGLVVRAFLERKG